MTTATLEVATTENTNTTLDLTSADGKKFLKRVGREVGQWRITASEVTEWELIFIRTIPAKRAGDAETTVRVRTDSCIYLRGQYGSVKSFYDSELVEVPRPRSLTLRDSDVVALAHLLASRHVNLEIVSSPGSTSSSKYGISNHYLQVLADGGRYSVGYDVTCVNGRVVSSGCIDF